MGRKFGGGGSALFFGERERGPYLTQSRIWPRPTSIPSGILIYSAIWPQRMRVENWEGGCAPLGRGAGSPSNTMWPGPRPTCMPSFTWIRQTLWPQYSNVTDRQDRQRSDSIGRTVLQTVAQKRDFARGCTEISFVSSAIATEVLPTCSHRLQALNSLISTHSLPHSLTPTDFSLEQSPTNLAIFTARAMLARS